MDDTAPQIDIYRALVFTAPGLVSEELRAKGGVPWRMLDFRAAQ